MTCENCAREIEYQRKLARLVIQVLDQQQRYFKGRQQADMIESKKLEAILRSEANAVLHPPKPPAQGSMI